MPTEVYREFINLMRLTGRETVSHKMLSELVAELELYGFVEVERKDEEEVEALTSTYRRRDPLSERYY